MATRFRGFARMFCSLSKQKPHFRELEKDVLTKPQNFREIERDVLIRLECEAEQQRKDDIYGRALTLVIGAPLMYAAWKYFLYKYPELDLDERIRLAHLKAIELEKLAQSNKEKREKLVQSEVE